MAMIELVDFNEVYNTEIKTKKKSRRRGGSKPNVDSSKKVADVNEALVKDDSSSKESTDKESSEQNPAVDNDKKEN